MAAAPLPPHPPPPTPATPGTDRRYWGYTSLLIDPYSNRWLCPECLIDCGPGTEHLDKQLQIVGCVKVGGISALEELIDAQKFQTDITSREDVYSRAREGPVAYFANHAYQTECQNTGPTGNCGAQRILYDKPGDVMDRFNLALQGSMANLHELSRAGKPWPCPKCSIPASYIAAIHAPAQDSYQDALVRHVVMPNSGFEKEFLEPNEECWCYMNKPEVAICQNPRFGGGPGRSRFIKCDYAYGSGLEF